MKNFKKKTHTVVQVCDIVLFTSFYIVVYRFGLRWETKPQGNVPKWWCITNIVCTHVYLHVHINGEWWHNIMNITIGTQQRIVTKAKYCTV